MNEKPSTLNQMRKKDTKYEEVDMTKIKKIVEGSKREEQSKEAKEKNIESENNIMSLIDNRINALKEEKIVFNKLKQEEIERRQMEESGVLKNTYNDNDLDIPELSMEYGDDDMEEKLIIHQEKESVEIKSSIVIDDVVEEKLVIYNEHGVIPDPNEKEFVSPIKMIESNSNTVMKSGANLSLEDASKINSEMFDKNDFDEKEIPKDIDYIKIDDEDEEAQIEKDLKFTTEELDKMFEAMRADIKASLKPIKNPIDISKFGFGKPVNINNASSTRHKDIEEHVLWNSKRIFAMEELEGFEVNELVAELETGGEYGQLIKKFKILYDHLRGTKPVDVFTWLKNTLSVDLNHIYMGGFISSFKDSNILAAQCDHCKAPYLNKYIPIKNMMKFDSPEAEAKYYDILNNPDDSPYKIEGKGYQISDDYLFKLKKPSIWKNNIEPYLLEPEFRKKYSSIINILTYVDTIYLIDRQNEQFRPIDLTIDVEKDDREKARKVLKNKIRKYGLIITKELNTAQFQTLLSYIYKEASEEEQGITYKIPESKCPKCNYIEPEHQMSAEDLLFTQHQVAQLGSI